MQYTREIDRLLTDLGASTELRKRLEHDPRKLAEALRLLIAELCPKRHAPPPPVQVATIAGAPVLAHYTFDAVDRSTYCTILSMQAHGFNLEASDQWVYLNHDDNGMGGIALADWARLRALAQSGVVEELAELARQYVAE